MRLVAYNQEMLESAIADIRRLFEEAKTINLSYEKAHKEKTRPQVGFLFAAIINEVTKYFVDCGFNINEDDVRYALYEQVSEIIPEMIVDKQIFGMKPRIKHIGDMDRTLMSKFIDGIFAVLDTNPMYAGLKLHPSTYLNYLFHLDPEEVKQAQIANLPERDENYLEYIRTQPCWCCGIQHRSEAHHTKITKYVSNSKKTPDWMAIPLCRKHHLDGAHLQGHEWLEKQLNWLPYNLETSCRISYLRYKNGIIK